MTATDRLIAQDQALLRANPKDWATVDDLAGHYMQKVREVGDPSYYPKVEALLTMSLGHDPGDGAALSLMGALTLARHQFSAALDWGQKAVALQPDAAEPYGVVEDAQVQLGRYPEAVATAQRMIDLNPDLTAYSRVSYLRELYGDVDGAVDAMRKAIVSGGPYNENVAYLQVQLGTLYLNSGRLDQAEKGYEVALLVYPGYYQAIAGEAAVKAARGDFKEAISLYQKAIAIYPLPQYVIALGDVFGAAGDAAGAQYAYDLASAENQLLQANGVDVDADLALFDADHGRQLPEALARARQAESDRPNVVTADTLAWTLYRTGDLAGALAASRDARRLGTRDALFLFHAGSSRPTCGWPSRRAATSPAR
jgi:tetratricopeptide (TPR) repeat protein